MLPFLRDLRVLGQGSGCATCRWTSLPSWASPASTASCSLLARGTWGFKAIPAAGEQLAELIATGRTPELIAPFALDRFAREATMADPSSAGTR